MRKKIVISSFLLFSFFVNVKAVDYVPLDTILHRTMAAAEMYNGLVESFQATVYTRTFVETVRRNFLYRFIQHVPGFVLRDPNNDEALIETLSTLRFEFPNNFVQDINHVTGTLTTRRDVDMIPFNLLHINIYGETTNDESFFMPTRFSTVKYYTYRLYASYIENGKTYFIIYYTPIFENTKLLEGHFIVESDTWRITYFRGEGPAIFSNFSFEITMGDQWITHYLPQDFVIHQRASYLGNVLESRHLARITYEDIVLRNSNEPHRSLNISNFYRVRLDSVPIYSDSFFWNEVRPIPLEEREKAVIREFNEQKQQALKAMQTDTIATGTQRMMQFGQRMVMNSSYKHRSMRIGYSGLLNPSMIGFSTYDGLIYRQKLSLNIDLYRGEQTLSTTAYAGYMFKHNDFFSDITTTWNYNPSLMRSLTLSVGNGNPAFSSLFIEQVQDSLRQSGLTFDDIALPYYRDYYTRLFNTFEITNGLLLRTGFEYHFRTGRHNTPDTVKPSDPNETADNIDDLFGTRRDFMPFVRVQWTPEQYYRYDGRQKIYVRSRFPTFKFELSRSFRFLGGMSEYTRVEFDVDHNIRFGLMQSFKYHIGAGMFINQKTEYFADFVYFSKSNFPESWNDGVGGIFNLLGRNMYNASDSYVQAHFMYETPFLVLKTLPFISNFADKERLYLSQLYTPQIVSYTELGYGVGNRLFNAAVFAAFHKFDFKRIGARIVFEM